MDEATRNWELAKAEMLKIQAAFLAIVLSRKTTYEELRDAIQKNIDDLQLIAAEIKAEVAKHDPGRN